MQNPSKALIDLETKFWQSMVDHKTDEAVKLLCEPALMVSGHGAMKFDHAGYRKMADQGSMEIHSFELSDMKVLFPNDSTAVLSYRVKQGMAPRGQGTTTEQEMNDTSTWVQTDQGWRCVMHTETPISIH
ncbi:MAG: nuclear transport factor 2 family protein [Ferruginibacter sp.]|nr:nuclear transport factor 2 family protein [Rhodoferax sp.]